MAFSALKGGGRDFWVDVCVCVCKTRDLSCRLREKRRHALYDGRVNNVIEVRRRTNRALKKERCLY